MDLIGLLIWVIILGVICYALIWVIDWIGLPAPFHMVAKVVVGLIILLMILGLLTGYVPMPVLKRG